MIFGISLTTFYYRVLSCILGTAETVMMFFWLYKPKKSRLLSVFTISVFLIPNIINSILTTRVAAGEKQLVILYLLFELIMLAWPYVSALTFDIKVLPACFGIYFTNSINPIMYALAFLSKYITDLPSVTEDTFLWWEASSILHFIAMAAYLPIVKKFLIPKLNSIPKVVVNGFPILVLISDIFPILTTRFENDLFQSDFFYLFVFSFGFTILLVLLIFIFYMKSRIKVVKLSEALRYQEEKQKYLDVISQYSDKVSKMSHDITNHLRTIQILAENSNSSECKEYSESLITEYSSNLHSFCRNSAVNAMLLYYAATAQNGHIIFNCDVNISNDIGINSNELIAVLSNIIDNAFEAVEKCDIKEVTLSATQNGDALSIVCSNNYTGTIKIKNNRLITTKADTQSHGIGTEIIKSTVNKYNGTYNFTAENNIFTVTVYMPLP